MKRRHRALAVLALGFAACGCTPRRLTFGGDLGAVDAYHPALVSGGDDGPADTVTDENTNDDRPARPTDARDACFPRPEVCNGLDDDCNGLIDDGFDFANDLLNCGRCGVTCAFAHGASACSAGRCRLAACEAGFVDLDLLPQNGCECQVTNGGVEVCDGKDNDCNGQIDEAFDLQTSLVHCGMCGRECKFDHATPLCQSGQCRMGACDPGFVDLDGSPTSGCEYVCTRSNGGVEICDGKDNDCNGQIDETDARIGMRCFPEGMQGCDVAAGQCRGGCGFGTWSCRPGGLACNNAVLPRTELCDGLDNNCDGAIDEPFDLQNDPRWCGACNRACDLPNAINGCKDALCTVKACKAGFVDLDRVVSNGCEYACTADGPEVCDGKDNDCDGKTDTNDDDLLFPTTNFCVQVGECGKGPGGSSRYMEKTFPACLRPAGATRPDWICNYPDTVQLAAPNQIQGEESWCDGKDNNCDGKTDEHAKVGEKCTDSGIGECQKLGKLVCQADKTLTATCDASGGAPYAPTHELCDGKDNDCDGLVDESWDTPPGGGFPTCAGGGACRGVRDDLVHVTVAAHDYYIHAYEASRADASNAMQGTKETRACSRLVPTSDMGGPPVLKGARAWTNVTYAQSKAACIAAGMRLCRTKRTADCSSGTITDDEWGLACQAGLTCPMGAVRAYPYGCTYDAQTCNGQDAALLTDWPTGSRAQCTTGDLDTATPGTQVIYDPSGNVAEWTDDCRATLGDGTGRQAYTLRGGSYSSIPVALRCDFMALAVAENFSFADTGFRCCSSCAPGLADCGACVNLSADDKNCGACGQACQAGLSCKNGACR